VLRAVVTERMQPGVVYTTFHHPGSGANVITTENSDWATNCPEYKVTAVQVTHDDASRRRGSGVRASSPSSRTAGADRGR
jgi:predicted molibdopterin-dependent oxidoreductase YjgC